MLTVYRRHRAGCKHRSRRFKSCFCPLWAQGTIHGQKLRKSLDLTSWEAAQRLVREWEIGTIETTLSVSQAVDKFLSDAKARNLSSGTIKKYTHVGAELKKQFLDMPLRLVQADDIRKLREGWTFSGTTTRKRLEIVKSFFKFCVDSDWIGKSPAKPVKPPKADEVPVEAYSTDEIRKITWAVDVYREIHPQTLAITQKKLKAMVLLMRYSAVRISDVIITKPDRIERGKIFLRTTKNKKNVWLPLPKKVLVALRECHDGNPYYFWSGNGKVKTCITDWQERLKNVFVIAGIPDGHGHRFRHTVAKSLLNKGESLETVAAVLGNSVRICEKHYSHWVKERQVKLEKAVRKTWA